MNSRTWYSSGSASQQTPAHLPVRTHYSPYYQNDDDQSPRQFSYSANTSPSNRIQDYHREWYSNNGPDHSVDRRNSKSDRFLLHPNQRLPRQASRSQEDVRSSGTGYNNGPFINPSRRAIPNDRVLDRLQLGYRTAAQFAEEDDRNANASTDDELDGMTTTHHRSREPASTSGGGFFSTNSSRYYSSGVSPSHDRPRNDTRFRANTNEPEMRQHHQRRAIEHRRASLHLDMLLRGGGQDSADDYDTESDRDVQPTPYNTKINNRHADERAAPTNRRNSSINIANHSGRDVETAAHSPSPHQSSNATMQLHFGGQCVKDYNQYSAQTTSLSNNTSAGTAANGETSIAPGSGVKSATERERRGSRPIASILSSGKRNAEKKSDVGALSSAFHSLNCHGPSGPQRPPTQQHGSYY